MRAQSAPLPPNQIEGLLSDVLMPGRYVGGEVNQVAKDPSTVQCRWALIYPDSYEIGMAHQGLRILYHCLNEQPEIWAERAFAPWADMEERLAATGTPLFTLESRTPLAAMDVLGFTLQTELSYSNILTCLERGGVPLHASERTLDHPLVVAGGAGALNPEPLAPFIDFFFLGDGEQAVVDFSRALIEEQGRHRRRQDLIRALLDRCPYLYAPAFWQPEYEGHALVAMNPLDGVSTPRRSIVYDLENAPYPMAPVVPNIRTIHDRITIEIMRGCVQGCRFCQAGMEKRPQRFRSAKRIREIAEASYRATGFNDIGLTSLSSSDHPDLLNIMDALTPAFRSRKVGLSLPSLRVNEQVLELPQRIRDARRSGLTLAPEVATDRLRRIINKGIADNDLYEGSRIAWSTGFKTIKLYFMIGIPGENDDDIAGIVRMAETCAQMRLEAGLNGPGQVTAAVSTFVPKPLTPFQWSAQMRPEVVEEKQRYLRSLKSMRSVKLKCHLGDETQIEGFLSRADRRSAAVLESAWRNGARFDAWDSEVQFAHWEKAWAEHSLGPDETAHRERPLDEVQPWDHLDLGVTREYLRLDYEKSLNSEFTEHCQDEACGDCGVSAKTCVDIKSLTGYFDKYNKPKLVERAQASPLVNHAPDELVIEPELAERSRRRARAAAPTAEPESLAAE